MVQTYTADGCELRIEDCEAKGHRGDVIHISDDLKIRLADLHFPDGSPTLRVAWVEVDYDSSNSTEAEMLLKPKRETVAV
jgi:hypothetical protein